MLWNLVITYEQVWFLFQYTDDRLYTDDELIYVPYNASSGKMGWQTQPATALNRYFITVVNKYIGWVRQLNYVHW
jgi:hypothetical protein